MQSTLSGSISGFIASGPMTLVMMRMHPTLPVEERSPLSPAIISDELARRAGLEKELNPSLRVLRSVVSHFGYGAAMGAVYSQIHSRIPGPPPLRGAFSGDRVGRCWMVRGKPVKRSDVTGFSLATQSFDAQPFEEIPSF